MLGEHLYFNGINGATGEYLLLSVLISVPGGLILVLPVVWQFIDRVMTQSKEG